MTTRRSFVYPSGMPGGVRAARFLRRSVLARTTASCCWAACFLAKARGVRGLATTTCGAAGGAAWRTAGAALTEGLAPAGLTGRPLIGCALARPFVARCLLGRAATETVRRAPAALARGCELPRTMDGALLLAKEARDNFKSALTSCSFRIACQPRTA